MKYSDTCNDVVDSVGFKDGVTCDATADEEEEEEEDYRACLGGRLMYSPPPSAGTAMQYW